jgi:hypothetical protein
LNDRRADLRAIEIYLRLVALGLGLRHARHGAGALRFQQVDLPLRQLEVGLPTLHRRLLLTLVSDELLGGLNGAV